MTGSGAMQTQEKRKIHSHLSWILETRALSYSQPLAGSSLLFCQVNVLRMRVVSATSEPTLRNKQHENTTEHDYTEFGLLNHRSWLTYFNAWFGEATILKMYRKKLSLSRIYVRISKLNKAEIKWYFLSQSSFLYLPLQPWQT